MMLVALWNSSRHQLLLLLLMMTMMMMCESAILISTRLVSKQWTRKAVVVFDSGEEGEATKKSLSGSFFSSSECWFEMKQWRRK